MGVTTIPLSSLIVGKGAGCDAATGAVAASCARAGASIVSNASAQINGFMGVHFTTIAARFIVGENNLKRNRGCARRFEET